MNAPAATAYPFLNMESVVWSSGVMIFGGPEVAVGGG
jgi:hypothetical protein